METYEISGFHHNTNYIIAQQIVPTTHLCCHQPSQVHSNMITMSMDQLQIVLYKWNKNTLRNSHYHTICWAQSLLIYIVILHFVQPICPQKTFRLLITSPISHQSMNNIFELSITVKSHYDF
jgi:hypothetical protein